MNRSIPVGGGPRTPYGRELAGRLPPLMSRLRGPEIDAIAANLDNFQPETLANTAKQVLRVREEAQQQRDQLQAGLDTLTDSASVQRTLEHHLRRTRRGKELWKDLRALRRWLDADAILERVDTEIDTQGVYLEILATLLEGQPLTERSDRILRQLLKDRRVPTRRAAANALALSLSQVDSTDEQARTDRSELLVEHILWPGEDIITARRCLKVLPTLSADRARNLVDALFGDFLRPDAFLLRAQAARISQAADDATATYTLKLAQYDDSETVRCALADGLAGRQDPDSLSVLRGLSRIDTARSVRVHARRLLLESGAPDALMMDPGYRHRFRPDSVMEDIADGLAELRPGTSQKVTLPPGNTALELARALVYAADTGHGFSLSPAPGQQVQVSRGEQRVIRLWRLLHELRNPTPDKRHLGDHLSGRGYVGPIRVPPERLGGASDTIPSARVRHDSLDSWAPWLPRPEDCLDAADWGSLVFLTVQGITTLTAPKDVSARLRAQLQATWSMSKLSDQRFRALSAGSPEGRGAYSRELRSMGYVLEFESHADGGVPLPQIEQYFPSIMSPFAVLLGTHRNTPGDLALATGIIAAAYFGRLAWHHHKIRQNRASIPLVIGGWGTRGKTGTERLKAALFEGLGYPVMCKTTGSEPSVLMNRPGQPPQVLPVYRPLGKASIWEQATLLEHAARVRPRVLLWECMALRDEYVDQLQAEWTRDDLSTITNAHPDHEDVQGPGAADVARVISKFIPQEAPTLTTEIEMLPILRDEAKGKRALLRAVDKNRVQAIGQDLLDRLPHDEHPENLALVAALASELGVDTEEALIMMGDHVVSDLGSLATSDPVRHLGRSVRFTNAMSANHKAGFLASWRRSGLTAADPQGKPDQYLVTVVNNRRDRVARSKAFASVLVENIYAHRHVLMGTNVQGLLRYIETALDKQLSELQLDEDARGLQRRLNQIRKQLCIVSPGMLVRSTARRLGLDTNTVVEVAKALDTALSHPPDTPLSLAEAAEILQELKPDLEHLAETAESSIFHDELDRRQALAQLPDHWLSAAAEGLAFAALAQYCSHVDNEEARNEAARTLTREIFLSHLHILESPDPLGEQVTRFVLECCPAGTQVHTVGMQNIGGAGLSFARDWAHGASLARWTEQLGQPDTQQTALAELAQATKGALPFFQEARAAVSELPLSPESSAAAEHLDSQIADRRAAVVLGHLPTSLTTQLTSFLKIPFSPLAAIHKQRKSEQIWTDLAQERISLPRAAKELALLESTSTQEPTPQVERGGLL